VLCDLSSDERKAFVQFVTGCSSLPPGGLANLYPRLTIVKKEFTDIHVMPSVNTCAHYLKIPEYPNEEMLKSRLLAATKEKAFLFN
jgi:E3 ubiquitin-protein ligase HECTD1